MSREAPWIALAIDWQDSEMLDGSSASVRLAWVSLLCFAKAQGRAGKVRFRVGSFARKYGLEGEAVLRMLELAANAGSLRVDGDAITILNWRLYQDPRVRRGEETGNQKHRKNKGQKAQKRHFSKTCKNDATIPPPTIPPPTEPPVTQHLARKSNGLMRKARARPTLAEVAAYCRERGNDVDPQRWFDHYESNGWMVGKTAMKDWKAAVRTWERNRFDRPQKQELPTVEDDANWTP